MVSNLFGRYIWIVDTIRRFGQISREEIDRQWMRSQFSQGDPLPRRTFYNYRQAIEELFNINIVYDASKGTYSIEENDDPASDITEWMLNSAAMTDMLAGAREVSNLIVLEDVPSAREHLSTIVGALREKHPICFNYHPYTRTTPTPDVVVEPYFLKIFKQRWYVTGLNTRDNTIKTYALDRISDIRLLTRSYAIPDDFDPPAYFRDSYGIVFNRGDVKEIVLRAEPREAKYLRALPLHHSQQETLTDGASLFHYRMKISEDLVQELLAHGPRIIVERPAELRALITDNLRSALANYESPAE